MNTKLKFKDTLNIFTGIWILVLALGFWYICCADRRPASCEYGPVVIVCDTAIVSARDRGVVFYEIVSGRKPYVNSFGTLADDEYMASSVNRGDTLVKQPNLCQWEIHKPDTTLIFYF
jgi:hypothetical protein